MSTAKENAIDLLNKGVAEKHKGNFDEAIDFYKQAKTVYPEYSVTYMNLAKVFIISGKFEHALRNLLTNIHLRITENEEFTNPDFEQQYQIDNQELKNVQLNNKAVIDLIEESHFNQQIAKEINVTFYAGLSYAGMNPQFIKYHKINKKLIESEQEILAGKIPSSGNLRQSKYVYLINIIGLKWLIDNVNTELNDQNEICKYYLDSTNEIRKPDTKIFNTKTKEVHEYTWWEVIKMVIIMPFILIPETFKIIWENIVAKNKKFHKRIFNVLASPFLIIFGPIFTLAIYIILKTTGKNKGSSISSEEIDGQVQSSEESQEKETYDDTVNYLESTEQDEQQYEQWKSQFRKKSVLEQLAEISVRAEMEKEEGFVGMILNIMELIYLHTQNKIEYMFIKEGDKDQFTLFLQMEIDEHTLGIGNSNTLEIYHCKLIRHLKFDEKDDPERLDGVYEFEIINVPKIGFSRSPSDRNNSKKIYIEDTAFERQTLLIIKGSGDYDVQLRNTIGLERYNSNSSTED